MRKKIYIALILIIILAAGYLVLRVENNKEKNSSRKIRIGYNSESVTNAPVIIAYEKGYFKDYGLEVEMLPLKSGKEVRLAMTAGQVDIGTGSFTNFMSAMAEGAPIRFIAASGSSPTYIFVRPDGSINKFADLYDKVVSVSASGINDLVFRTAMEKENIDTARMQFTETERAYQTIALIDKKAADAVIVSEQDTEMFLKAGAVVLPDWKNKGYAQNFTPRNSIAINTDFLGQNESIAWNFLKAYIDAHRLLSQKPLEAAELLAGHIKKQSAGAVDHLPEKLARQWQDREIINMIWQNPAITMELVKKAKEIGALKRDLAIEEIYDLRFKDKLQAAQIEVYGQTR
jgi:NitT/TauT family transport system substrate-binding protein